MSTVTRTALDGSNWVWFIDPENSDNYGWVKESDGSHPELEQDGGSWEVYEDPDGTDCYFVPEFRFVNYQKCPFCNNRLKYDDYGDLTDHVFYIYCDNHDVNDEPSSEDAMYLSFPTVCYTSYEIEDDGDTWVPYGDTYVRLS